MAGAPPAELEQPRALTERLVGLLLSLTAAVSVLTTAGIVLVLVVQSAGFFRFVSPLRLLTDTQWTPLFAEQHFGIRPLLAGTLLTTSIAVAVAVPLGLLGAVYLAEFAAVRTRRVLKPLLEILAGVPTVVYGYFALTTITPALQRVIPDLAGFNALSAGIVMGVMILPIVASLSEDAITAVPSSLREGALALGATRVGAVGRVVLPTASSGIGAAVLLGLSRAIGETMIVTIAAGQQPRPTLDPRDPVQTMTAYIVQVSQGDTPTGTLEYHTLFAVGMCLFLGTLVLNLLSFRLRRRVPKGGL